MNEGNLAQVWEYKVSPLFTEAKRMAFDFAIAAASQPNDASGMCRGKLETLIRGVGSNFELASRLWFAGEAD